MIAALGRQHSLNFIGGVVAGGLIGILAFVTWALVFRTVPETNENALLILIGILATNIGQVVNWFFGSSSESKKQTDTIETLAKTAQTAGATLAQPDAMVIPPGTSATATATESGTVITPDVKP
jgi:hypothetical protein